MSVTHRRIATLAGPLAAAFTAVTPLVAQPSYPARCGTAAPSTEQGYVPLPRGDVFCPLVADPKATRSFASYLRERSDSAGRSTPALRVASVGIGDMFGLGRWSGARPGDGLQLSLSAGVFAQFDLGADSYDLLNADYVIGLPITLRNGWFSTRLRVYHQSSHLGDEYLLREPPDRQDRENLSFESAEMIVSADAGALRVYGGGEYLFNRNPRDLEHYVAHGGVELRPWPRVLPLGGLGGFRLVAAADFKASQEHDWKPSISARAGLEYDRSGAADPPGRRWGIFVEFYDGPSPYGQFFRESVRYAGAGVHFGGF
jgi:hypothetical protein